MTHDCADVINDDDYIYGPSCAFCQLEVERNELRAEVERLKHLHNLDHSLADQWEAEVERLRAELRTCQETLTACLESS
jgi:predicted ribosome quality control (RQC) complex YloA/Tae2 family protein